MYVTNVMFSVRPDSQFQFHLEGEEGCLRTLSPVLVSTKTQGEAEHRRKVQEVIEVIQKEEREERGLVHLMACLQLMIWKAYLDGRDLTSHDITATAFMVAWETVVGKSCDQSADPSNDQF